MGIFFSDPTAGLVTYGGCNNGNTEYPQDALNSGPDTLNLCMLCIWMLKGPTFGADIEIRILIFFRHTGSWFSHLQQKQRYPRWWFQTFFIFPPTWGNDPI